jgi:hypothetical protein
LEHTLIRKSLLAVTFGLALPLAAAATSSEPLVAETAATNTPDTWRVVMQTQRRAGYQAESGIDSFPIHGDLEACRTIATKLAETFELSSRRETIRTSCLDTKTGEMISVARK